MRGRYRLDVLGRHEWREVSVDDPPPPGLRIPYVAGDGTGQLVFRLAAVENGVAVYLLGGTIKE